MTEAEAIDDDTFEVIEMAGAGGMGTVYRAKDKKTGRILAVKMLHSQINASMRFTLEANVLAKLVHPTIVEYVRHGTTNDRRPYLAMEWLEGTSLEDRLTGEASGTLPITEALRITRAMCDALVVAQEEGIIHRDLKPSNVFLTTTGEVKLLDFGIAKSPEVEGLTGTGQTIGTPGYMSPEQAAGGDVDGRSDLFSLGCVIFRMLGGKQPFRGSDLMVFATQLALEEAPPLRSVCPDAPQALTDLVAKLLAKKPGDRPSTAKAVRDALDQVADEMVMSAANTEVAKSVDVAATKATGGAGAAKTKPSPAAKVEEAPPRAAAKDAPPPPEAPKDRRALLIGAAAVVVLVGAVLGMQRGKADERPMGTTSAGSSPSTSTSTSTSPGGTEGLAPIVRDADRVTLTKACKEWAAAIARTQNAKGGFAGSQHSDPTGWDTAQQTFALTEAHRSCEGAGPAPIAAGVKALERLHVDDGWIGMRRASAPNLFDFRAETPANAWALMAIAGAQRVTGDASLAKAREKARADLGRGRLADGGYRFVSANTNGSTLYSTMLAAWALLETDDPKAPLSAEAKRAFAWLRKEILARSESVRAPGIAEQVAWVFARGERRESDPANAEALRTLAADVVAHCNLEGDACTRPLADTGHIPFDDGSAKLVALWHPWATVASFELAREPALPLDADTRAKLTRVARWGNAALASAMPSVAMASEYKIGEYLIAVSRTLEP